MLPEIRRDRITCTTLFAPVFTFVRSSVRVWFCAILQVGNVLVDDMRGLASGHNPVGNYWVYRHMKVLCVQRLSEFCSCEKVTLPSVYAGIILMIFGKPFGHVFLPNKYTQVSLSASSR